MTPEQDELATGTPEEIATGTTDDTSADGSAALLEDGSADESDEQDWKSRFEQEKARADREARERERLLSERSSVEEERRRLNEERQRPVPPPTTDHAQRAAEQRFHEARERRMRLEAAAQQETGLARDVIVNQLDMAQVIEYSHGEALLNIHLARVPDEFRDDVERLIRSGEVREIKTALKLVKLDRQERTASDDTKAERERHDKVREEKRLLADTEPEMPTRSKPAASDQLKPMKQTAYAARLRYLTEEGRFDEKRQLIANRQAGRLPLVPG